MRLFQINEDDLAILEKSLPELVSAVEDCLDNRLRTKVRCIQNILTNVRWDYGPATEVGEVDNEFHF